MSVTMGGASIFEVRQNEIGMVSRQKGIARRETLFTVGLNPCIGVLLWDDNWVVLGHLHDSRQTKFELSYKAVIDKMRADAGGSDSSTIYGGIVYERSYSGEGISDHRGVMKSFLQANKILVQTDTISGTEAGSGANVAVSRHGKSLVPKNSTAIKYVKPVGIVQGGEFPAHKIREIMLAALPCVTIVTGANEVEIYSHATFSALGLRYGLA